MGPFETAIIIALVLYSTLAETFDWETIADMEEEVVYFEDIPSMVSQSKVSASVEYRTRAGQISNTSASHDWDKDLVDDWKSPRTLLEEACMALAAQEAKLTEKYTPKGASTEKAISTW
ncbi:hypothetical protein RHGRI_032671 [Rhododendron griersonianum]|uniref:Uncharacterized protein n=1 Tax=Rhododendron griersonianum TaxID=479676 RepID=A0AAV6IIJ0_9ERIC|nr:hypothetical protein RHGRI_032671 [Rhododendron griersonianum]